jgi:hypothetical protein
MNVPGRYSARRPAPPAEALAAKKARAPSVIALCAHVGVA